MSHSSIIQRPDEKRLTVIAALEAMNNTLIADGQGGEMRFSDYAQASGIAEQAQALAETIATGLFNAEMTVADYIKRTQANVLPANRTFTGRYVGWRFSKAEQNMQTIHRAVDDFCQLIGHDEALEAAADAGRAKGVLLLIQMDGVLANHHGQTVHYLGWR